MLPAADRSACRYGVKGRYGYVRWYIGCDSDSPLSCLVWTRTTVVNSSTSVSIPIAARRRLPSPGRVLIRRTLPRKGCHVEQKNGNVVCRLVGYDRYASKAAFQCLDRLYYDVRLYMNFFQSTMKLYSKTRHGARVHRVYEKAQTPYQRLLETGVLTEAKQQELATTYHGLNPVLLLKRINSNLEQLWRLAQCPTSLGNRNYEATRRSSVTV